MSSGNTHVAGKKLGLFSKRYLFFVPPTMSTKACISTAEVQCANLKWDMG